MQNLRLLFQSIILAILFVSGLTLLTNGLCCNKQTVKETIKKDTVYVTRYIEIPSVESSGYAKQEKVYITKKDDKGSSIDYNLSSEILTLLSQRDSLTALLDQQSISIPVTLCETIQATNDSICITYDEVSKKIDYSIKFAARKIDVPYVTETKTIVEETSIWEKIGYGILGAATAIVSMELF